VVSGVGASVTVIVRVSDEVLAGLFPHSIAAETSALPHRVVPLESHDFICTL